MVDTGDNKVGTLEMDFKGVLNGSTKRKNMLLVYEKE